MKDIDEIIKEMHIEKNITLEDIPNIDLYMDQVIQLFEATFNSTKRDEKEKILTKTMINNYAKGKLFFPIKNKKYSREHIILISLIYQLKPALTINDIKTVLDGINEKIINGEEFNLDQFYNQFLQLAEKNIDHFLSHIKEKQADVHGEISSLTGREDENLENVLLIASLVNMSNLYKRLAEKLVDEIAKGSEE